MKGKMKETKRAVFVVFETKNELYKFYRSNEFMPLKMDAAILTEENSLQEKTSIIANATISGKITLFTKIFGRGTDFIVYDQIISANGGVHVIQTFLSEEFSEEIQIQGRTARQGEDGSYSLIVSRLSLEKFLITKSDLESNSHDIYSLLNKKRNDFFLKQYAETNNYLEIIKEKHKNAISFLNDLFKNNDEAVKSFILFENKGTLFSGNSKTIILIDATGSMYTLLDKTKKTLEVMLGRVGQILEDNNFDPNSFQIKIVVYRNYNSNESEILQSSTWENKAHNLINFLKTVYPDGGWGNEAIEMGLWYANQEDDLSQVILIGDGNFYL